MMSESDSQKHLLHDKVMQLCTEVMGMEYIHLKGVDKILSINNASSNRKISVRVKNNIQT